MNTTWFCAHWNTLIWCKSVKNPQEIEILHSYYECGTYTTAQPLINAVTKFFSMADHCWTNQSDWEGCCNLNNWPDVLVCCLFDVPTGKSGKLSPVRLDGNDLEKEGSTGPKTVASPESGIRTGRGTVADFARALGIGMGKPPSVKAGPGYCRCARWLWGTGNGAALLGATGHASGFWVSEIRIHSVSLGFIWTVTGWNDWIARYRWATWHCWRSWGSNTLHLRRLYSWSWWILKQ